MRENEEQTNHFPHHLMLFVDLRTVRQSHYWAILHTQMETEFKKVCGQLVTINPVAFFILSVDGYHQTKNLIIQNLEA